MSRGRKASSISPDYVERMVLALAEGTGLHPIKVATLLAQADEIMARDAEALAQEPGEGIFYLAYFAAAHRALALVEVELASAAGDLFYDSTGNARAVERLTRVRNRLLELAPPGSEAAGPVPG